MMDNEIMQSREALARQVIHALDDGMKIVDSIAKKDGKWKQMVYPANDMISELYAYAEQCREDEARSGQ